jgi:sec-independent protein translocase protein TatB
MFDISWTEFLLIGVIALIVIGPKELPGVMRALGQWTRKVRGMAADFQNQFQEAMREAEMTDLKKQVDDLAHDIKNYDPLKDVRTDVESSVAGVNKDIESSMTRTPGTPEQKPEPPAAAALPATDTAPPAADSAVPAESAVPTLPVERGELEPAAADAPPPAAEPVAEAAPPDSTGRAE